MSDDPEPSLVEEPLPEALLSGDDSLEVLDSGLGDHQGRLSQPDSSQAAPSPVVLQMPAQPSPPEPQLDNGHPEELKQAPAASSQPPSPGKVPKVPPHEVCRVWLPLEFGRGFSAIRVQGTVAQAKAEVLRKLESQGKADPESEAYFAISRSSNPADRVPEHLQLAEALASQSGGSAANNNNNNSNSHNAASAADGGDSAPPRQLHLVRIQGQPRFRPSIPLLRMMLVVEDARIVGQLAGSLPAEMSDQRHFQEAVHVSWTTVLAPPLGMAPPGSSRSPSSPSPSPSEMSSSSSSPPASQSSPSSSSSSSSPSSSPSAAPPHRNSLSTDLGEADAIVLCYTANSPESLERLKDFSRKLLRDHCGHQASRTGFFSGSSQGAHRKGSAGSGGHGKGSHGVASSLADGFRVPIVLLGVEVPPKAESQAIAGVQPHQQQQQLQSQQQQPLIAAPHYTADLARAFAGLELRCPHVTGTGEALGPRLKSFCGRVYDERLSGSRTYARSLVDDTPGQQVGEDGLPQAPAEPAYHKHDVFVLLEGDNGQGVATGEQLGRLFKVPTDRIEILNNNSSVLPRFVHIEDISIPTVKWMEKYTLFGIEVRPRSSSRWVVFARYSRCLRLFEALKRAFPEHAPKFPPFPKKKLLFNNSTSLVETRRAEISAFLQHVVSIPQLMQSPSLQEFLETRLHSQEVIADSLPFWVKAINEAPEVVVPAPEKDEAGDAEQASQLPVDGGEGPGGAGDSEVKSDSASNPPVVAAPVELVFGVPIAHLGKLEI